MSSTRRDNQRPEGLDDINTLDPRLVDASEIPGQPIVARNDGAQVMIIQQNPDEPPALQRSFRNDRMTTWVSGFDAAQEASERIEIYADFVNAHPSHGYWDSARNEVVSIADVPSYESFVETLNSHRNFLNMTERLEGLRVRPQSQRPEQLVDFGLHRLFSPAQTSRLPHLDVDLEMLAAASPRTEGALSPREEGELSPPVQLRDDELERMDEMDQRLGKHRRLGL